MLQCCAAIHVQQAVASSFLVDTIKVNMHAEAKLNDMLGLCGLSFLGSRCESVDCAYASNFRRLKFSKGVQHF